METGTGGCRAAPRTCLNQSCLQAVLLQSHASQFVLRDLATLVLKNSWATPGPEQARGGSARGPGWACLGFSIPSRPPRHRGKPPRPACGSAEPRLPVRPPGSRNPGPQELPASRRSSVAARDTSCCISQYVGWPLQTTVNGYGRKLSVGTGPHVSGHECASLAFHHSDRSGSLRQDQQGVQKK